MSLPGPNQNITSESVQISDPLPPPLNNATTVNEALIETANSLGGGGGGAVESVNGKVGIVNLTTADIDDSNNRRYVTESEKTKLSNTSGTNSGDQNSSTVLLSEALPVPLASETTVQGALSSIAPLLDHPVDSVNGLTGAVTLTTDNIGEATNKKYVTDAEKILLGNTSGSNTGDQDSSEVSLSATLPAPLNTATTVQEALVAAAPLLDHPVDSVNGKTGSVTLSTADINDSTDKRYVTDSQIGIIQNTTGTNTGDQDSSDVSLSTPLPSPLNTASNVQNALEQIAPLLDPPVDSVNGQTGTVVLTTADIADSTDKRYVTETEKTKLSNLSGTNSGDQNSSSVLLSAALPAPLASETTVQGALSAIAPFLGGSSSESVIYEFTQSGLSPSVGKQIRPTSSGWVNAQGNTIENATNVWTIISFSGDDIVACKVGRVNIPLHGLGEPGTLLYLSPTTPGGLTPTKPVGTSTALLGFYLPVIFIEDAWHIHVLGQSYPSFTNILGKSTFESNASEISVVGLDFSVPHTVKLYGNILVNTRMYIRIDNGTIDTNKCNSRFGRMTVAGLPENFQFSSTENTHPLTLTYGTGTSFSAEMQLSKDSLNDDNSIYFIKSATSGSSFQTMSFNNFGFSGTPPSAVNFSFTLEVESSSFAAGTTIEISRGIL